MQGGITSTPCWICTRMCCRQSSAEKESQTGLSILGVSSGHFHDVASSFYTSVWFDMCCLLKLPKVFRSHCPSPMLWIQNLVTRHTRSTLTKICRSLLIIYLLALVGLCQAHLVPLLFYRSHQCSFSALV